MITQRTFGRCAATLAIAAAASWVGSGQSYRDDALENGFQDPPDSARPRVWWHWMNGNITWEGAKADMDWMKRVGIRGLQTFDAGAGATQVAETRLPYMTEGWKQVLRNAAAYADKLGLELGTATSPGWSETGGPWVQTPDAMKKMSWAVTRVHGGRRAHFVADPAEVA
jgi:alpha-L-rhamnosidase